MTGLKASLNRFGLVQPIVWNSRSKRIVGGHQRVTALLDAGEQHADVLVVDLADNEEKALNVTLNNPHIAGDFTIGLQDILDDIQAALPDLMKDLQLDKLIADLKVPGDKDADEVPPVPKKAVTKPGQVIRMGEHVLYCLDSTDPKTVERVKADGLATLTFTSPPYWVGMPYEYQKNIKEIETFIGDSAALIAALTRPEKSRILINTGTGNGRQFHGKVETLLLIDRWVEALRPHGWLLRHLRMWIKNGGMPASISPRNDFIDQHSEFIGTFYNVKGKQRGQQRVGEPWVQQGFIDDIHGKATSESEGEHCASFPVELPDRFIRLYTQRKEIVLDPFGGAGTTLIACQQLDRPCRLIERDPRYCDVIVDRWEKFSGGKAKRI